MSREEVYVNRPPPRWIDRLSTSQYLVLLGAVIVLPTVTSFGLFRLLTAWRKKKDIEIRVRVGRKWLKEAAAFDKQWYNLLLPKRDPNMTDAMRHANPNMTPFPNLAEVSNLGKGVTPHNWRSTDFPAIQRSLDRIDKMTPRDLFRFTTLYTQLAHQKEFYELVDKSLKWVMNGEATYEDIRMERIPEAAVDDLPKNQQLQWQNEKASTMLVDPERRIDFMWRIGEAEAAWKRSGNKGPFHLMIEGDDKPIPLDRFIHVDDNDQHENPFQNESFDDFRIPVDKPSNTTRKM